MPSPSPDRFHAPQDRFWRVIDAALNRAREGARVVEDFCRFVLDAPELTQRLKDWRHRLAHLPWPRDRMVATRDTRGDVGTTARTEAEATRRDPWDIVRANLARTTEAVRTLEEFTK
ncbi:MAG: thiamine phosphate synthase, partial [Planctomycetota bacterium]